MAYKYLLFPIVLLVTACSQPNEDLHEWVKNTQASAQKQVKPYEVPTVNPTVNYIAPPAEGLNSFSARRLNIIKQGLNTPNFSRPKETLETFSLENLKYVGSLKNGKSTQAFVEADGHVYTIGIGNYLNQNFRQINSIDPDKLSITEVIEDTYGNWVFRKAELPLSSNNNTNKQTN